MAQRPNLLLIWTDEQRADTMACYGNDYIRTPNLNRLAERSFVFENAYCAQPVCTPSRGTVLTGLWPHTHRSTTNNVRLGSDVRTIAEMVDPEYRRAYFGKWHLGDEIVAQHGFDEWISTEDDMYRAYYSKKEYLDRRSDYHHYLIEQGFATDAQIDGADVFSRPFAAVMAERYTKAAFLGRNAASFLRDQTADRPFMLSVNFLEPHMPFMGPLNHLHDPDEVPVGPSFCVPPPANASNKAHQMWERFRDQGHSVHPLKTEADFRRLRANYYGLTSLVDNAVGEIFDALEASGQADRTIVVFTSDHGDMMGDHGLLTKGIMYEEAVHIPLLVRVPWATEAARRIPGRISQIDLAPTLLDLMEHEVPEHLQGRSRRNVLEGTSDLGDNDVFIEWNQGTADVIETADRTDVTWWRTIIDRTGWKLDLAVNDRSELYDLNNDPHELKNLFDAPEQKARVAALSEKLRGWQAATGDVLPLPRP